jgi:RNA polymerase sigma-70 factor (ECF subfamily)
MTPASDQNSDSTHESSFVASLTSHQPALHAFLTSLLPGESAIDDILQQTNLVLWEKRADFQPGTNFKAWAFTVARWQARAWLTTRKRRNWLIFDDQLAEALSARFVAAPPEETTDALSALRRCLGKLRESDRLLLLSHYQHQKSLEKCAQLFDRTVNSLKVSLFRLRAALRRCIRSQLAFERVSS